tara:strand:- start:201 stop:791 length:591 start_codon:yes stop_codon:yes gene_type:complete
MIEKNDKVKIQDNFLARDEFIMLRDAVSADFTSGFPWFFCPHKCFAGEDQSTSPGQFIHMIYSGDLPRSIFYESHFLPIINALDISILSRIKLNLNLRLPEPFYSDFHVDITDLTEDITSKLTTSIFYINTNNGYTELETGEEDTRVESVANRLVTFPANIKHRGVTQTDEQKRIVINFNYLELPPGAKPGKFQYL